MINQNEFNLITWEGVTDLELLKEHILYFDSIRQMTNFERRTVQQYCEENIRCINCHINLARIIDIYIEQYLTETEG